MKIPNEQKFDWTNITDDYKKMQQISGLTAATGMLVSLFVLITAQVPKQTLTEIWYVIILGGIFTAIYYLFPNIYTNKHFQFLPDLVYVACIASLMILLGDQGNFFYIFLLLILSINAFSMTNGLYAASFFEILFALVAIFYFRGDIKADFIDREALFQLYGVISFGIMLRIFSTETISLRRRGEELAQKTKDLLAQKREIYRLIDNISDGIIAVDLYKNITLINAGALRTLGMVGHVRNLIGKNIDDILTTASAEGRISIVENALNNKEASLRDDLRLVKHDKTIRLHTNTAPVLDDQGKISGAIVLFRDITLKKELEEQRAEFNAIASHELRTPLTVIEGYLYYLLSDKKLRFDAKTRDYIEKTYESANGLLQLSNDILTVIKSDENKIEINLSQTDLKKIINDVIKEQKTKAENKGLQLIKSLPKNEVIIKSDGQKIKEVLTNLVENAIKFTEKGKVKVVLETVNKKEIMISVIDTGIGINEEAQALVFRKFYRSEDWKTRKTGGTGLGLYISKTLVARLGGEIGVESDKDKGSKFWFTLPLNVKKQTNKSERQLNEFIKSI